MAWVLLVMSGLLEVAWASAMKASEGFTKPLTTVFVMVAAGLSFWLLAYAMRFLPLGTAYPVLVGIGALGTFVVGIIAFSEEASALRIGSAALIVAGIAGLKMAEA